jgi:hypothetical protein
MLNPERNPERTEMLPYEHRLLLSNGEIHFLWWFIQGSIMSPSTREQLWTGWGMCERHAWGFISVEAAFREGYMHGPAILYEDLMNRARGAFVIRGPMQAWRSMRIIGAKGPCLMCDMEYGPNSKGSIEAERVRKGRDLSELRALALKTSPYWQKDVCGRCAGNDSAQRCRRHLIEEISHGIVGDVSPHASLVNSIAQHIATYARSFRYGYHGTQTDEDMAALISAVGWCSGWKTFLSIVK